MGELANDCKDCECSGSMHMGDANGQCKIFVVEDPHVDVVHVMITGEDEIKVNKYDQQVHVECTG